MTYLLNIYIGLSLGTAIYAVTTGLPGTELLARLALLMLVFAPLFTVAAMASSMERRKQQNRLNRIKKMR